MAPSSACQLPPPVTFQFSIPLSPSSSVIQPDDPDICAQPNSSTDTATAIARFIPTPPSALHVRIVRPAAALGRDPDDVLRRILDVAGLAVHAVLRVDLQPGLRVKVDELVHPGGAVAAFGTGVLVPVDLHWNGRIL